MRKVVIALGGNAILQPGQEGSVDEQLDNIDATVGQIARIIADGDRVVLTHGNGPQIGAIMIQNAAARDKVPAMPMDVCGAKSQGMLGYMIQQRLSAALKEVGVQSPIASLITQVSVDESDPAFARPTKPVGPFYSEAEARAGEEAGENWVNDADRGWRRVVPSPEPEGIVESESIQALVDAGVVVICGGGGGVPVVAGDSGYRGVEAVIDKDFASQALAQEIGADVLMILTDVRHVMLNYGKPNAEPLSEVSVAEAERYVQEGHFGAGSMAPKVRACLRFTRHGGEAVITSLDSAVQALGGEAGTRFATE